MTNAETHAQSDRILAQPVRSGVATVGGHQRTQLKRAARAMSFAEGERHLAPQASGPVQMEAAGGGRALSDDRATGPASPAPPDEHDRATAQAGSSLVAAETTKDDYLRGVRQEGMAGWQDMEGMLDRQKAQHELSSRFQVIPDDYAGARKANMVTQAEFEKIARTFSDIRSGAVT
jgi:hypothetical protein